MKKQIFFTTIAAATLLLTACGSGDSTNKNEKTGKTDKAKSSEVKKDDKEMQDKGDLGDYFISIDSAEKGKDYSDKTTVIISYTFKNNGKEDKSFDVAVMPKVFQNKAQLETAITADDGNDNVLKDVQPGGEIKVKRAYVLPDENAKVDVQVEKFMDKSKKVVKSFDLQ